MHMISKISTSLSYYKVSKTNAIKLSDLIIYMPLRSATARPCSFNSCLTNKCVTFSKNNLFFFIMHAYFSQKMHAYAFCMGISFLPCPSSFSNLKYNSFMYNMYWVTLYSTFNNILENIFVISTF